MKKDSQIGIIGDEHKVISKIKEYYSNPLRLTPKALNDPRNLPPIIIYCFTQYEPELIEAIKGVMFDKQVIIISSQLNIQLANEVFRVLKADILPESFLSDELKYVIERNSNRISKLQRSVNLCYWLRGNSVAASGLRENLVSISQTSRDMIIVGDPGCGSRTLARLLHDLKSDQSKMIGWLEGRDLKLDEQFLSKFNSYFMAHPTDMNTLLEPIYSTLVLNKINWRDTELRSYILDILSKRANNKPTRYDQSIQIIVLLDQTELDYFSSIALPALMIPKLNERREDLCTLLDAGSNGAIAMDIDVMAFLYWYDWPGNIEEMESFLKLATNQCTDDQRIHLSDLPLTQTAILDYIQHRIRHRLNTIEQTNIWLINYFNRLTDQNSAKVQRIFNIRVAKVSDS